MIPNIAALSKQFNTYMYLDKKNIQINSFFQILMKTVCWYSLEMH